MSQGQPAAALDAEFFGRLRGEYGKDYNDGLKADFGGYPGAGHWDNAPRWKASARGIMRAWCELGEDGWPMPPWTVDLGCGRGKLVTELRALDPSFPAVGIDIGDDVTEEHCVQGNVLEMPWESPFQLVVALDIIEHIPSDYQDLLWHELRRVTGHLMLVTVPTMEPHYELDRSAGLRNHYYSLTPAGWAQHFVNHGFRVLRSGSDLARLGPPFSYGDENFPFALARRAGA